MITCGYMVTWQTRQNPDQGYGFCKGKKLVTHLPLPSMHPPLVKPWGSTLSLHINYPGTIVVTQPLTQPIHHIPYPITVPIQGKSGCWLSFQLSWRWLTLHDSQKSAWELFSIQSKHGTTAWTVFIMICSISLMMNIMSGVIFFSVFAKNGHAGLGFWNLLSNFGFSSIANKNLQRTMSTIDFCLW